MTLSVKKTAQRDYKSKISRRSSRNINKPDYSRTVKMSKMK